MADPTSTPCRAALTDRRNDARGRRPTPSPAVGIIGSATVMVAITGAAPARRAESHAAPA